MSWSLKSGLKSVCSGKLGLFVLKCLKSCQEDLMPSFLLLFEMGAVQLVLVQPQPSISSFIIILTHHHLFTVLSSCAFCYLPCLWWLRSWELRKRSWVGREGGSERKGKPKNLTLWLVFGVWWFFWEREEFCSHWFLSFLCFLPTFLMEQRSKGR